MELTSSIDAQRGRLCLCYLLIYLFIWPWSREALSDAEGAMPSSTQTLIFTDRFAKKPTPPPIQQASGHIFKGPYLPGTELTLTFIDDQLDPLGITHHTQITDAYGQYQFSNELPYGLIHLSAHGTFFNEHTGLPTTEALTLEALTTPKAWMNIHLLTHLETERIKTLLDQGRFWKAAKAEALQEWMARLGHQTRASDSVTLDLNGQEAPALLALSAIVLTATDGSPRSVSDIETLLTQWRDDFADGELDLQNQQELIQSAAAALDHAASMDVNLKAVFEGHPSPPTLSSIRDALLHTLNTQARSVTVIQTAGGEISPTGTHWSLPETRFSATLTPNAGHSLAGLSGTCQGELSPVAGSVQFSFISEPLTEHCDLSATFSINQYEVSGVLPKGATLSPSLPVTVLHGEAVTFEFTPPDGVGLFEISGCGGTSSGNSYTTDALIGDCSLEFTVYAAFELASNGITVVCDEALVGELGVVDGQIYTKRSAENITPDNAASTCTSGVTNMTGLFAKQSAFNGDISHWDTSSVTTMMGMFQEALAFNQDISHWETRQVVDMNFMFYKAASFAKDLSGWCVPNINPNALFLFSTGSAMSNEQQPDFGAPCEL